MSTELVVSILGFLGTLIGAGRWLVGVWFKKSEALENLKHENHQLKITSLKNEADNIRQEFESMKAVINGELKKLRDEMSQFRSELERVVGKYNEHQQSAHKVLSAMDSFSTEVRNERDLFNRRLQYVESEMKNYGQVIIKDGKRGS